MMGKTTFSTKAFLTVIAVGLAFLGSGAGLSAQEKNGAVVRDSISFTVYFRRNSSEIEGDYHGNGEALRRFANEIQRIRKQGNSSIEWPITVTGSASPEGPEDLNRKLAESRAAVTADWLMQNTGLERNRIVTNAIETDWDALLSLLERSDCPYKDSAIAVIKKTPALYRSQGSVVDSRKRQLMNIGGGACWKWMDEHIFPNLRTGATIQCVSSSPAEKRLVERDTLIVRDTVMVRDTVVVQLVTPSVVDREYIFAFRSNLLVPLMNVGIEFPVGPHWSLEADWYSPWIWPAPANKECFELQSALIGVRWWMRAPRDNRWRGCTDLTGPSLGLDLFAGHYDFERDYAGRQGEFMGASLDFTWGTVLGKGPLRMEFTLGAGYVYTPSRTYHVNEYGGVLLRDSPMDYKTHWVGPTRAAVSLVLPISHKTRRTNKDR